MASIRKRKLVDDTVASKRELPPIKPWDKAPRDYNTAIVTVSPKFQIVIPEAIRQSLELKPGQQVSMVQHGNTIKLMAIVPGQDAFGSMPDLEPFIRDRDDRF